MPGLPSLDVLSAVTEAELGAQERRGDALDSKAGIVLGFAGVLVGLSVDKLHSNLGHAATWVAAVAAISSGLGFIPRSFPALGLRRLRDNYLTAEAEFTKLRLLDTRIAMYGTTEKRLRVKSRLVSLATAALGVAVLVTVLAATLK